VTGGVGKWPFVWGNAKAKEKERASMRRMGYNEKQGMTNGGAGRGEICNTVRPNLGTRAI